MVLTRLELAGFKSFAKRTVLDFPHGITAIVGPNGSGKSNIVDGIRWVLAERALQNLRGKKGEDLIFHGGGTRGGMARARVEIHFTETGGAALDMAEVLIGREVDRTGENVYSLNGRQVRLLDLEEFLSRSGIGGSSFRVLSQGMSDMLLTLGPREFRGFIEEAAGVKEFQDKKHRARIKLRHAEENIEKTEAVLSELAPRLRFLKRETAKFAKREIAEKKMRELALALFGFRHHTLVKDERRVTEALQARSRELAAAERAFKEFRDDLFRAVGGKDAGELQRLSEEISKLEGRDHQLLEELVRREGEAKLTAELAKQTLPVTREYLEARLSAIIKEGEHAAVAEILQLLRALLREITEGRKATVDQSAKVAELAATIEAKKASRASLAEQILEARTRRQALERKLEDERSSLREKEGAYRQHDEELRALRERHAELLLEEERIKLRRAELEREIRMLGVVALSEVSDAPPRAVDEAKVEAELVRARRAFELIGAIDPAIETEYRGLQERYDFLLREKEDLTRALASLRTLIKELEREIKTRFSEALKDMNEAFASYFRLMFNGGKGSLHLMKLKEEVSTTHVEGEEQAEGESDLEEYEDEITEGIEIRTEIPGKKIKNLSMLSGGERTLVSIALLFALVNVRRPPFLVLDEIDAALDETNSQRFIRLLAELGKRTQFIIITHNRETMRGADALYGVSMKDGISHLLSLKLEPRSEVG